MPSSTPQNPANDTEVVMESIKKAPADCGAPFEPETLNALSRIKKKSTAEYQRLREEFKKANPSISVVNLDREVKIAGKRHSTNPSTHHGFALSIIADLTSELYEPVSHEGVLYKLNPKTNLWEPVPFDEIVQLVATLHDGQENCAKGNDYRAVAQHALSIVSNDNYFADAPMGVATPAGFVQFKDGQITVETLTPIHRQRVKIHVTPEDTPKPLFTNYLQETFQSSNPTEMEQQIRLIQEVAGAIILGIGYKYQKAFLFYDPFGRAGKGTFERIIRELVPINFQTSVSPFNWDREYYLATLSGKRLNVVGELPEDRPIPAAAFKTVTGGDLLTGRNPTGRPFSFKCVTTHLFMSNHLINTADHSEAFFARWVIIKFPNSRLVKNLPLDPELPDRIIASELPGIAYWALEGARRLLAQQRYSDSIAHTELMSQWRRRVNSLDEFIHECCELSEHYHVRRSDLYSAYVAWCKDGGRRPFSSQKSKTFLPAILPIRFIILL